MHIETELFVEHAFTTHHHAAGKTFVVIVPPLFEELARTRKVLVNMARELARTGCDTVRFDYPGSGLSPGTTRELTPSCAASTLDDVVAYCRKRGATDITLLGLRFGAYLAMTSAIRLGARVIAWEPVLDPAAHFQELLRAEVASQVATYGHVRRTRDQLVAALRAGDEVLVDGNWVCSTLYREMDAAPRLDLDALPPELSARLVLLLWDNKKLHERARRAGIRTELLDGIGFSWRHIRTLAPRAPHLFDRTLAAVQA